jgi:hypothetical protein
MSSASEKAVAARTLLVRDLRRYLVGPVEEQERIEGRAADRYHTGFLSPSGVAVDEEEDDQEEEGEDRDAGAGESILALANVSQQSAMGMTFQVEGLDTPLELTVRWADYRPEQPGAGATADAVPPRWVRHPFEKTLAIPADPDGRRVPVLIGEFAGIEVKATTRVEGGVRTITTSLVNARPRSWDADADPRVYQVSLEVFSPPDARPVFVARPPSNYIIDEELWNFELLYRDVKQFAVGHGCSVEWEAANRRRATRVRTTWIPEAEVYKASAAVLQDAPILLVNRLTDPAQRTIVCEELDSLPAAYATWIDKQKQEVAGILRDSPASHREGIEKAAADNLGRCEAACRRIREGIGLLKSNDKVWHAFCLSNRAMELSMRKSRPDREPRWFAFQLAFILMSLPSAALPDHPDRSVLDLIWFPTGGGKTEAYLGLTAFCMFHRRLAARSPDEGSGTAVLTRYTLRLLTIQQFERAARVVCACELVRRQHARALGATEFSIGLFVGGGATPNTLEEAEKILQTGPEETEGLTTLPLLKCPWCGSALARQQQRIEDGRLITPCTREGCEFRERLPVLVVDDEIYAHPPTMVVGTVDKFARMAWVPAIRELFGAGRRPPPDLIIQDELHLISDALGTMAALYETAVDYLCSTTGRSPKVVGSTATIRRAEEQCQSLFQRRAVQFPPSGLSATDSFFYREDRDQPGRLYVGVHAQGRSPKHSLAWATGTLCQSASRIEDPAIRDSYHTLVMYFNSLRELGGALVLAEDDVPRYIDSMPLPAGTSRRRLILIKELTSHLPSFLIPDILDAISTPVLELRDDDDLDREPIDLVLATNMISVGVDVDRLGLMVINGQPKTTSEYIQASSRVGRPRGGAGLVVTLYNWTRPRDRSHYERFVAYHQAFYRHVESTSVTPFSSRARDRALHAVLVALSRLLLSELQENDSAGKITSAVVLARVRELATVIVRRAEQVDPAEAEETMGHLERIIERWRTEAVARQNLPRKSLDWRMRRRMQNNVPYREGLLRAAEKTSEIHGVWPTPQSLRDVEPSCSVELLTQRMLQQGGGG